MAKSNYRSRKRLWDLTLDVKDEKKVIKTYGKWMYSSIIIDLDTRWNWVQNLTQRPLCSRRQSPWYRDWIDPRAGLDAMEERKYFAPAGNRTPDVQLVAYSSRYTDWFIPAPQLEVQNSEEKKIKCACIVYECRLKHFAAQIILQPRRLRRLWTYHFTLKLWVSPCHL
jgi:hypothetical protein